MPVPERRADFLALLVAPFFALLRFAFFLVRRTVEAFLAADLRAPFAAFLALFFAFGALRRIRFRAVVDDFDFRAFL